MVSFSVHCSDYTQSSHTYLLRISLLIYLLCYLLHFVTSKFKMAAVKVLNPKAEVARAAQALAVNITAAQGLQDVLRSNLGPKGTMKMLVKFNIRRYWFNCFSRISTWRNRLGV